MVKLNLLSSNIVKIMEQIVRHQELCKYLWYNEQNPLAKPNLVLPADKSSPNNLYFKKLFPYPFDISSTSSEGCELRVYSPRGQFKNRVIEDSYIFFDIVVSKNLWLINNDGVNALLRPYEIMKYITETFDDKSIDTVGKLVFTGYDYFVWSNNFNGFRLPAKIIGISK